MRTALAFLTVLPVGGRHRAPGAVALVSFPLAGLAIGVLWAAVAWAGTTVWTPWIAAALVVAVDLAVTGALHLDAVADVADGVASRRPREQALAIMREPTVGAVGAAAVATTLLLRAAFVAALVGTALWPVLVAVPVCGRAAMVVALARSRSTRSDQPPAAPGRNAGVSAGRASLAHSLGTVATPSVAAAALVITLAVALGLGLLVGGVLGAAGGAAAVGGSVLIAVAGERTWRRRFGPLGGDAAGAIGLAAELAGLAALSAAAVS